MPDPERLVRRVVVEGFVQGVGYRDFVRRAAARRDVTGWVRNRADGTVEALIGGAPDAVEAMLADLRRGPPGAAVRGLHLSEPGAEDETAPSTFEIRPSA